MSQIKEITVYTFAELSETAKSKVLNDLYDINVDYDWWRYTYDVAENVGIKITGFDIDCGSYCKGDLLLSCEEVCANIIRDHGDTCETYKTAQTFLAEKERILNAAETDENGDFTDSDTEDKLIENETDFTQSILEDYRIMLSHEYDYLTSKAAIIETIEANNYTFTESGKMENI